MTALTSVTGNEAAWERWERLVNAVGATVVGTGQADMTCPVHGGDNPRGFTIGVGERPYPLLACRTRCDMDEPGWIAKACAALLNLGAPPDALPPTSARTAGEPTSVRASRSEPVVSDEQAAEWETALWNNDKIRDRLCDAWRIDDDVLSAAEVGWDARQRRYAFPVRDTSERVVQVIYRSLTAVPKSKTHKGVTGSHLYSPFALEDGVVLLLAGERDVFTARAAGWNAVTFTNGERSVPPPDALKPLRGRDVVVIYDNDVAGRAGSERAAAALARVAASVAVADLAPYLRDGGKDVSDLLSLPDGADLLRQAVQTAEPCMALTGQDDVLARVEAEFLVSVDSEPDHLAHLLDDDAIAALQPIEYVIEDWVPAGTYTVVYGEPGVGKTFALLSMTRAVRKGTRWQGQATQQGGALIYQGEGVRQFRDRIAAWDARYPLRLDQSMSPGASTEVVCDLTKPSGVAAVIRTVRGFEHETGAVVRLLVIDPLVEYMTGEENGEGMERVSRGLRALAKLLNIGVVVGHHSNASGDRERGAAFLRMRAGAFVRMEALDETGDEVGLFQHKQRNGRKVALRLERRASADSLVLEYTEILLAEDYVAQKESDKRRKKAAEGTAQRHDAEALLLEAVGAQPGLAKDRLLKACRGQGVGSRVLEDTLAGLVVIGRLRVESGARGAQRHYLADAEAGPTPSHPDQPRGGGGGSTGPPPTPAL